MAEATEGEVIAIEAEDSQGSPYTLTMTHKSYANCFRMEFSIALGKEWSNLGLKGLPSKLHKPLVFLFPLMSHCNSRFPKTMDGKRLSTQQSPNIMTGPICPYLLPRLLTRSPKLHLSTHQLSPLMLVKG
jgi:hypothetical protein